MEDEQGYDGKHTPTMPYCDDPACWCHQNWHYHQIVIRPMEATDEENNLALAFLMNAE